MLFGRMGCSAIATVAPTQDIATTSAYVPAFSNAKPLVYLHGIDEGIYVPAWPVFIVADDPRELTFTAAVDDALALRNLGALTAHDSVQDDSDIRRGYITRLVRQRIHQQAFRERVLQAYRQQCALCRLKHGVLLDAAHIVPDSDPEGEPVTSNGISLCKLHHAAFDRNFLAIRPDYIVEIRLDLLDETDGQCLSTDFRGCISQQWICQDAMSKNPTK